MSAFGDLIKLAIAVMKININIFGFNYSLFALFIYTLVGSILLGLFYLIYK